MIKELRFAVEDDGEDIVIVPTDYGIHISAEGDGFFEFSYEELEQIYAVFGGRR